MGNSKTTKSVKIIQRLVEVLKTPDVFNVIKYQEKKEDYIKAQMYPYIIREVAKLYEDIYKHKPDTCLKKAKENLLWEGNTKTTVNNVSLFGTCHRPDMVLEFDKNMKIAIEVKRGDDGKSIREGIGQSIVYSQHFNFVILLFVDIGKQKEVLNSINGNREQSLKKSLWDNYNIVFEVV